MSQLKMSIIIIGDGEVGKTSMLRVYDKKKAPQVHMRTVGVDYIQRDVMLGENPQEQKKVKVKIWDTAG